MNSYFSLFFFSVQSEPLKFIIAFFAGLIPVLIWLWFWEHEDKHPEPKKLVFTAFLAGMLTVLAVLPLEEAVKKYTQDLGLVIFIWAAIEEILKFGFAYVVVLSRVENDEPIDSLMYMITVALGFAALENALFIFRPLQDGLHIEALTTGNLRFIGATLLHTITSSIIGFALAFTFYRSKKTRVITVIIGVITAITLHAHFNLSIIRFEGTNQIIPFYFVWIAVIAMLLAFEKVKTIKPSR